MSAKPIRAVLFDLDGTLVDTLPDIAAAMNRAIVEMEMRALAPELIGSFVGNGPRVLAQRVLDQQEKLDAEERTRLLDPLLAGYVRHYEKQAGALSHIFPGVLECLRELSARGLKMGVVTNSLQHIAEAILAHFRIAPFLRVTLGGDRVARHKPHPEPLWQACRMLSVEPRETVMVGDSANDVLAAQAAGCTAVAVPHGYDAANPVAKLGCEVIENFAALPRWITLREQGGFAPRQVYLH